MGKNGRDNKRYDFLKDFYLDKYGLRDAKEILLRLLRAAYGEISLNDKKLLSLYLSFKKEMVQLMQAVSGIIRKGSPESFSKPQLLHHAGNLRLSLYLPPDRKPATAWDWLPKCLSLDEIADPAAVIRAFFKFKPLRDWPHTFEELYVSAFSVDSRATTEFLDDLPHYLTMQEQLLKFLEAASLVLMRELNIDTLPGGDSQA